VWLAVLCRRRGAWPRVLDESRRFSDGMDIAKLYYL
jgi:hypothetical protein